MSLRDDLSLVRRSFCGHGHNRLLRHGKVGREFINSWLRNLICHAGQLLFVRDFLSQVRRYHFFSALKSRLGQVGDLSDHGVVRRVDDGVT